MESLWAFLKAPAIHIAVARDAFVFDISWLGIVLVVGALLLFRRLRR
ncbi:MAG TPA: LPXTG cell wall anchor domain-containing protein [Stellaceae bacterium]|nr:LPXTG cell wall anchor domain-containing protein [Stellaceae bacterium]